MLPQTGEETCRSRGCAGLDRTFVPALRRRMRARGSRTLASALCSQQTGEETRRFRGRTGLDRTFVPAPQRTMRARGSCIQASARCELEARAPWQAHDASQRLVYPGKRTMRARGSRTQASARCSHKRGRKPAAPDVAPGIIGASTRGWDDLRRKRSSVPLHALRTSCESLHSSHLSPLSSLLPGSPRSGSTNCTLVPGRIEE
jgi:hypothetical protein